MEKIFLCIWRYLLFSTYEIYFFMEKFLRQYAVKDICQLT